jgi:hypothetical protein
VAIVAGVDFGTRRVRVSLVDGDRRFSTQLPSYKRRCWQEQGGGIENNNDTIFKDLRGAMRKARLLKRNDEACKGLLIAPSLGFSQCTEVSRDVGFSLTALDGKSASGPIFAARMASRRFVQILDSRVAF